MKAGVAVLLDVSSFSKGVVGLLRLDDACESCQFCRLLGMVDSTVHIPLSTSLGMVSSSAIPFAWAMYLARTGLGRGLFPLDLVGPGLLARYGACAADRVFDGPILLLRAGIGNGDEVLTYFGSTFSNGVVGLLGGLRESVVRKLL